MSVLLDDGNLEFLFYNLAVLISVPLTMACKFRVDDNVQNHNFISLCRYNSDVNYFSLRAIRVGAGGGLALKIEASTRAAGGTAAAYSGNQYSQDTWHHAAFVSAGIASRYAYLDGVPSAEETTSRIPFGISITGIGVLLRDTIANYMSGDIAEVGIWHEALSTPEIAALAKGFSPLLIKPAHLAAYLPLIREGAAGVYRDRVGGRTFYESGGSTPSPHPRVIYPRRPHIISAAHATSPPIVPVAMRHYRNMRIA